VTGLRVLAGFGAVLFAAGWIGGWFAVGEASVVAPLDAVRPDAVLGAGLLAWLLALPLAAAPFVPFERPRLVVAWVATVPALVACVIVPMLRPRTAVGDVTVGEYVVARPVAQTASLTGAAIVVMALVAAWRRAPDWRVPPRWAGDAAGAGGAARGAPGDARGVTGP